MPASLRTHVPRGTTSSRPYDRRSPTASPTPSEHNPPVHPRLSRIYPPVTPIQDPDPRQTDPDNPPDHPGLPTYAEYKRIEAGYLFGLSPRKRDKALITQAMFDKIWDVLHQPEACTIETPQFRFWVRKMFTLSWPMSCDGDGVGVGVGGWGEVRVSGMGYPDSDSDAEGTDLGLERTMGINAETSADLFSAVVLHENRPVAIMEQLYELFCYCHVRAGHGGRDKTCAVIRQHYSWVPKELTAQFVKACPTCALKRCGNGHGAGGMVDMGALVQRRAIGHRERRVQRKALRAEGTPAPVLPSSLGSVGWPTTGGPLDPANHGPCGVREEREWLHAREDAGTVHSSSLPMSPALTSIDARYSKTRTVPRDIPLENGGWSSVPRTSTVDSPFHLCDTTNRLPETASFPRPFGVHDSENSRTRNDWGGKRSPMKTGLPSLASALSNESLDDNVGLTGLGPESAATECLPPALRPLRLSGPIPPESESDPLSSSNFFQIDPALLSFNYPGLVPSKSGSASSGADVMPFALSSTTRSPAGDDADMSGLESLQMPVLERSMDPSDERDSPDSSFESAPAGGAGTFSLSTELLVEQSGSTTTTSPCGSWSRYGYRDGPLAMLYHCSADEVGQELDRTFPFSIVTDA